MYVEGSADKWRAPGRGPELGPGSVPLGGCGKRFRVSVSGGAMVYVLRTELFYLPIFSPLYMNCQFITFVIAEYYLQISA